MSWPSVSFRSELSEVQRKELDLLCAQITAVLSREHHADGSHGTVTADAITTDLVVAESLVADTVHTDALVLAAGATALRMFVEAAYPAVPMGHTGAAFTLGASVVTGWYQRLGSLVTFRVALTLGAGFVWPAGNSLMFTLPPLPIVSGGEVTGQTTILSGSPFAGFGMRGAVPGSVALLLPAAPSAPASGAVDVVTATTPIAAAVGVEYRFAGSYRTT